MQLEFPFANGTKYLSNRRTSSAGPIQRSGMNFIGSAYTSGFRKTEWIVIATGVYINILTGKQDYGTGQKKYKPWEDIPRVEWSIFRSVKLHLVQYAEALMSQRRKSEDLLSLQQTCKVIVSIIYENMKALMMLTR